MTDFALFERQIMQSVSRRVHERLRSAADADLGPEVFGDPEEIAEAMVAALPLGHVFDEITGPFYDTSGLIRWLGITRQALHQKVARYAILACPLDDAGLVYPTWQFLGSGTTIPSLRDVLLVLTEGTDDPWLAALWMQVPSDDLGELCPADWLREGRDPHVVIEMARQTAAGWRA